MVGFMGLVELGSMTESQLAAGRSYHGVDGSPCMDGSMKGASRVVEVICALFATSPPSPSRPSDFGPSSTAARKDSSTGAEKYDFFSHNWSRSCNFFMCFGAFVKEAALLNKAGRCGAILSEKCWLRVRNLTWNSTSFRT